MWEKASFSLWRNTPSPPPGSAEEAQVLQKWVKVRERIYPAEVYQD
jgi:hypothetical protein